jgi:two-component system OmpR family response regulator
MSKIALLIEDEAPIRELLGKYLEELGIPYLSAGSVPEARQYFDTQDLGLVITDLNMPLESGHLAVRWFLKNRPSIPVIVFSANANASNRLITALYEAEEEAAGVVYIEKPDFVKVIEEIQKRLADSNIGPA